MLADAAQGGPHTQPLLPLLLLLCARRHTTVLLQCGQCYTSMLLPLHALSHQLCLVLVADSLPDGCCSCCHHHRPCCCGEWNTCFLAPLQELLPPPAAPSLYCVATAGAPAGAAAPASAAASSAVTSSRLSSPSISLPLMTHVGKARTPAASQAASTLMPFCQPLG